MGVCSKVRSSSSNNSSRFYNLEYYETSLENVAHQSMWGNFTLAWGNCSHYLVFDWLQHRFETQSLHFLVLIIVEFQGDAVLAREKYLSMVGHITGNIIPTTITTVLHFYTYLIGNHVFPHNTKFQNCAHDDLSDKECKPYLDEGGSLWRLDFHFFIFRLWEYLEVTGNTEG